MRHVCATLGGDFEINCAARPFAAMATRFERRVSRERA
jgi:hypothetical protein